MTRVAALADAAFAQIWRALGCPRLTVIAPVSEWDLPPGFVYRAAEDALTDAAGKRVTDLADLWTAQQIPVLPARSRDTTLRLDAGGLVDAGRAGYVTPEQYAAQVKAAWGVRDAQGQLWRVTSVAADLPGGPVTIEMERR